MVRMGVIGPATARKIFIASAFLHHHLLLLLLMLLLLLFLFFLLPISHRNLRQILLSIETSAIGLEL